MVLLSVFVLGGGESALEFGGGVVVGFCFGGRRGPVSFRAVKGKGGESALELSCSAGNDLSQLWSLVVDLDLHHGGLTQACH